MKVKMKRKGAETGREGPWQSAGVGRRSCAGSAMVARGVWVRSADLRGFLPRQGGARGLLRDVA
jgi:hypothetical protein